MNKVEIAFSVEESDVGLTIVSEMKRGGDVFSEAMPVTGVAMSSAKTEKRDYLTDEGICHTFEVSGPEAVLEKSITILAQRMLKRALHEGYLSPNPSAVYLGASQNSL